MKIQEILEALVEISNFSTETEKDAEGNLISIKFSKLNYVLELDDQHG